MIRRSLGLVVQLILVQAASCARAPTSDAASRAMASATAPGRAVATTHSLAEERALDDATAGPPKLGGEPAPSATTSKAVDGLADGQTFLPEAQTLFRVAACGGTGEIPPRFDSAVVTRHCDELVRAYEDYRRTWVNVAKPFLAALRPQNLPSVVVYPFGGGDLASALATFPGAEQITTISLEPAGDVRPIDTLAPDRLAFELSEHRVHLERLFEKAHSRTDNLEKESKTTLPGEIVFALAALVVHGDEPVALRYFRLNPNGSLDYVTRDDIEAAKTPAERRALFANAELSFRRLGDPSSAVQVLRHVSFNLDDTHLKADPSLVEYLNATAPDGKVAVMTKAATHLLWSDHFSLLRNWLVAHTDWMVSDSTGIPPRIAVPAGFTQDAYGTFEGPAPFGDPDPRDGEDLKRLFKAQPKRELAFRYGYPDRAGHAHLLVTHR